MKVIDFDGRLHPFPPTGHTIALNDIRERSSHHLRVRTLLKKLYPLQKILEEVPIPGIGLFADFYLPHKKTLIEVHGSQHYEFSPFFHGSLLKFQLSKNNDKRKREWCILNNIRYIELRYDKDDDEWKKLIVS